MSKHTFADEGVAPRGILTKQNKGERKPAHEKLGKNALRTYITDDEMKLVQEKAQGVPLATYVRNFLRNNGFFE